jgi:hypothetical protein
VSARKRSVVFRASLLGLASLSVITCTADPPQLIGTAEQEVVNPPLPGNLNLALNAKTSVTVGAFAQVFGDVGSSGPNGSVLFDVSSSQGCCSDNVLANTVTVKLNASVGHVFGNDITIDGFAAQRSLGLDPAALPPVPAATPATPGTTNVSTNQNQAKQLCPGQYGAISLGVNSTLNLNGGVYQVTRLTLADGARLEPSEPVVILVTGGVTTGIGSVIRPSDQSIGPMSAGDIRIEVGGAVTLGDSTQVRAHLLVPTGKFTMGRNANLTGAVWAKTINIGAQSFVSGEGVFSTHTPSVPPPCNDNNVCTADVCVGGGTSVAFCRNTPLPTGASCEDGNVCNGAERCDAAGQCQAGQTAAAGTSCPDGNACNGDEACNGFGSCLSGTPPNIDDGNTCTTDSCNPATGVSNVPVDDGTVCSGSGVCDAGVCSIQGTVFSELFTLFQDTSAQCNSWNNFLFSQLVNGSYGSVTMSGSFDTTGITCTDPAAATQICQALHNGNFISVFCNGHQWNTGQCGGTEVSIDTGVCSCNSSPSYTMRPCIGFDEWGGVNTQTCFAPTQTMSVVCD